MILLEAVLSDIKVQDAVSTKVSELEARKKSDVVVNYQMITNPDKTEYILDFIESDGPPDALRIVEWNAYRYKRFTDKAGHKGLVLLGASRRAYGSEIKTFFGALKESRGKWIKSFTEMKMPEGAVEK